MGGNLFKLGRLPQAQYQKIEEELCRYLNRKFGAHYRIPRYYADKPDFGDMDIVVSEAAIKEDWQQTKQELVQELGLTQYKSVGAVFSTVYQDFQVDYFIRKAEYFESTYHFLSFNDIGNLIGRIFKKFNLKYGEQGLIYVFRRADDHYVKDIPVSVYFQKIFTFLQLDYEKWEKGFANKREMFDWVVASPYFSVTPYQKLSATMEKRVRDRPTIKAFIDYLAEQRIDQTYDFLERDAYIPQIAAFFPEANLIAQIEAEKEREAYANAIREKFNGKLVMQLIPKLQGKALGLFIKDFRDQFENHEQAFYEATAQEIQQWIVAFYERWKEK
ncbi:MAG: hypothetical protein ACPGJS_01860 [Flammeovirgaceae bacterium]